MAALLLAAAALATRPWWLGRTRDTQKRRGANVAAYRTRLAELENERETGLVAAPDVAALKGELDQRLLAEAQAEDAPMLATARRRWLPVLLASLALAVFAGGWYAAAGTWRSQQQLATKSAQDQQVTAMVQRLADKLQQQPDNAEGWAMLGRSYFVMKRFAEAAKAYAEANSHAAAPNPDWLSSEGEALGFARDRDLQGTPVQLFDRALAADPKYGKALWYGGLAAAQAGDNAKARDYWQRLAADPELAPQMRELVAARMQALDAPADAGPAVAAATTGSSVPAAPAPAGSGTALDLHISLAAGLAAQAAPDAVLFVFAKAAAGPPMPLAVQRLPGAHLPLQVRLDDSMAMAPSLSLSQFDRYVVTARLSRSGGAQAQSGDLEGSVEVARAQSGAPVSLQIDRAVP
jgi:cytochrome c-type biogenesis protein CcmH